MQHKIIFFHTIMASQGEWPISFAAILISSFCTSFSPREIPDDHISCGSSHSIPTFSSFRFSSFLDWDFLLRNMSCMGARNSNPTLDTMYSCIDYREGECYAKLCLLWIPRNLSLWIPTPPASLYFSDFRFTIWTYLSLSLVDIWYNAYCVASHVALCYTHILVILITIYSKLGVSTTYLLVL